MSTGTDNYTHLIDRKYQEYGDKFDPSDLSQQFADYYGTNTRLMVEVIPGHFEYGTVGVTTGWKPVFILIHRRTDYGSSTTLTDNAKIIGIKYARDRHYRYQQ